MQDDADESYEYGYMDGHDDGWLNGVTTGITVSAAGWAIIILWVMR